MWYSIRTSLIRLPLPCKTILVNSRRAGSRRSSRATSVCSARCATSSCRSPVQSRPRARRWSAACSASSEASCGRRCPSTRSARSCRRAGQTPVGANPTPQPSDPWHGARSTPPRAEWPPAIDLSRARPCSGRGGPAEQRQPRQTSRSRVRDADTLSKPKPRRRRVRVAAGTDRRVRRSSSSVE